jgi:hypothetical protein
MAEYFNQIDIKIREIATLQFNHFMSDDEIDVISFIVCNVEFLPHMSKILQDAYDDHKAKMAGEKAARETNKSLS